MMFFVRESCPHCRKQYKVKLLGLSSRLGPKHYICQRCFQIFNSGCIEWQQMGIPSRVRYILLSIVYIITLTILGGVFLKDAYHYFQNSPSPVEVPLDDTRAWINGIPIGILTATLQYFRVVWSTERRQSSTTEIVAYPFLWTTNLHLFCLVLLLTIPLLGAVLYGVKVVVSKLAG